MRAEEFVDGQRHADLRMPEEINNQQQQHQQQHSLLSQASWGRLEEINNHQQHAVLRKGGFMAAYKDKRL
jgi:hypothetical protein